MPSRMRKATTKPPNATAACVADSTLPSLMATPDCWCALRSRADRSTRRSAAPACWREHWRVIPPGPEPTRRRPAWSCRTAQTQALSRHGHARSGTCRAGRQQDHGRGPHAPRRAPRVLGAGDAGDRRGDPRWGPGQCRPDGDGEQPHTEIHEPWVRECVGSTGEEVGCQGMRRCLVVCGEQQS